MGRWDDRIKSVRQSIHDDATDTRGAAAATARLDQIHASAQAALYALARCARGLLESGESPEWTTGIIAYVLNERLNERFTERDLTLIVAAAATFIADPTRPDATVRL